jgi:pimeloyl-ACP methyl ester carboxylesterase
MRVVVNGTRIWFDVEGAGLVPDGRRMRRRPMLVLLHGGPGFDHSYFKPSHSALSDTVQLLYVDHRGNGRSDYSDPAFWNLAQWADDLRALLDLLEIENPIVLGLSFGGFVAQSLAVRIHAALASSSCPARRLASAKTVRSPRSARCSVQKRARWRMGSGMIRRMGRRCGNTSMSAFRSTIRRPEMPMGRRVPPSTRQCSRTSSEGMARATGSIFGRASRISPAPRWFLPVRSIP